MVNVLESLCTFGWDLQGIQSKKGNLLDLKKDRHGFFSAEAAAKQKWGSGEGFQLQPNAFQNISLSFLKKIHIHNPFLHCHSLHAENWIGYNSFGFLWICKFMGKRKDSLGFLWISWNSWKFLEIPGDSWESKGFLEASINSQRVFPHHKRIMNDDFAKTW